MLVTYYIELVWVCAMRQVSKCCCFFFFSMLYRFVSIFFGLENRKNISYTFTHNIYTYKILKKKNTAEDAIVLIYMRLLCIKLPFQYIRVVFRNGKLLIQKGKKHQNTSSFFTACFLWLLTESFFSLASLCTVMWRFLGGRCHFLK